jgi:hypothetical protein
LGRTTIHLAPADVKKGGPSFDLPTAKPATVCKNAGHARTQIGCQGFDSDVENKAPFSESIRK